MSRGDRTCTVCGADHVDGCVNIACPIGYHNVKSIHPKEIEESEPDPLEYIRNKSFRLGQVSALEDIAPELRKRAGECFAAEQDSEAQLLRKLASDFRAKAQAARDAYHNDYPNGH